MLPLPPVVGRVVYSIIIVTQSSACPHRPQKMALDVIRFYCQTRQSGIEPSSSILILDELATLCEVQFYMQSVSCFIDTKIVNCLCDKERIQMRKSTISIMLSVIVFNKFEISPSYRFNFHSYNCTSSSVNRI